MFTAVLMSMILVFSPLTYFAGDYAENYSEAGFMVETIAGTGTHGARDGENAQFNLPAGIFSDGEGNLIVLDTVNNLIRLITFDEYGNSYTVRLVGVLQDADEFGFPQGGFLDSGLDSSLLNRPTDGVFLDEYGLIVIVDSANNAMRIISSKFVAEHLAAFQGVSTPLGSAEPGHVDGHIEYALFYNPTAIAIDADLNIFVADTNNHVIRKIDFFGYVTTIAGVPGVYGHNDGAAYEALFNMPMGIAINEYGVIFVADTENHLIRVIEDGYVRTLAGTLIFPSDIEWDENYEWDFDEEPMGGFADGYEAMFNLPVGLSLWYDVLIVADSANHRIRAVLTTGETITLAGTYYPGHTDGPATYAEFHFPRGVYVVGDRVYVADTGNNMIRVIILGGL